jgi:antitoxin component YwqK of YwqJK toxin-antitoxin module
MKINFSIISVFISTLLFSQNDTTYLDVQSETMNGVAKNGYFVVKKNNVVISEGNYENDRAVGMWKDYYENGNIEMIAEYSSQFGRSDYAGTYKDFFESGKIKTEGQYLILDNDSIECVNCYDLVNCLACYDSVNYRKIEFTKNWPLKDGIWKEYYENGVLKTFGVYYLGLHETRNVMAIEGTEVKATTSSPIYLKHKEWNCYDEMGKLIRTEYYYKGILVGEETF